MYKEINIAVGARIREKRKLIGFSSEQLASAVGITNQFLCDVERGKKSLSYTNMIKLCSVLYVSTDYILTGKNSHEHCYDNIHYKNCIELLNNIDDTNLPYVESSLTNLVSIISAIENIKDNGVVEEQL